ncbi:MAG: sensor histidine kinase, partial [Planctomycetota bacterium]|jgi:signal transduction histidine kinase
VHLSVQWQALQALRTDALAEVEYDHDLEVRSELEALMDSMAAAGGRADRLLQGSGPRRQDRAFDLWARTSDLNRRADGCLLLLLDPAGAEVSEFALDIPPRSWLPELPALPDPEDGPRVHTLTGRKGAERRSFLVASTAVVGDDGVLLGGIKLVVPSMGYAREDRNRPELLRNYSGGRPPLTGRRIHRAVFEGDVLVSSTNPDYPRGMRAPRDAVDALLGGKSPEPESALWIHEEVAGNPYHNAYMARDDDEGAAGLLSVGFPSLTVRDLLLNLARVGFLLLLAVTLVLGAAGVVRLASGDLRAGPPGFRVKVLAGFILVGGLPVVGLALLDRNLAEDRARERMEHEVRESLLRAEATLRDEGVLDALAEKGADAGLTDDRLKEIAYRIGVPVNVFLDDRLLASSERGIFATELFSQRISGEAFHQVALLGRDAYAARERFGEFPFLVGYAPLHGEGNRVVGILSVPLLFRQDRVDRDLARRTTVGIALYVVVLLLVAGVGTVLAGRMARPVESLSEGTRRVAAGDLGYRIPVQSDDELGALVDSFNRMTEDLQKGQDAAARAEREAAWREMAKQVAHEIKNPLTPMRLHAQHLLRAHRDGAENFDEILEKSTDTIQRQTEALQRIATDFSDFARLPRRNPETVDIAALCRDMADLFGDSEGVDTESTLPEIPAEVYVDREEFRRVLVNLCGNAVEAMPDGGTLSLAVDLESPGRVRVRVSDTGTGIADADRPHLFEPSFSTKTSGTGLGLAIVKRAVEDSGGTIEVASRVGEGSAFTVTLPVHNR